MSDLSSAFLSALMGGSSGANVDDVLAFRQQVQENNILNDLAPAILGAKFNTSTWEPAETLGVTAGQAFLGTLLSGLARRDAAQQFSDVAQILPQLYEDPRSVAVPAGVDPEAFGALKLATIARGARQKADTKSSIIKDLLGVELEGLKAEKEAFGKIKGETTAYGAAGIKDPNSPQSKLLKQIADEEDARRKEIGAMKTASSVSAMISTIPTLEAMVKDTATSDIPFIYKFVQAQDGGVVKEGEMQMVQGSSPVLQKYAAELNKTLNGASALTPGIKQQMVDEMKAAAGSQYKALIKESEPILQIGESRGANRGKMLPFEQSYIDALTKVKPSRAALEQEAAVLRSQGLSAQDVAKTLRSKYGG